MCVCGGGPYIKYMSTHISAHGNRRRLPAPGIGPAASALGSARAPAAGRVGAAPYADEEGVASVRRRAPEAQRGPGIKKVLRTFPPHNC